jgi:hypothetical protein
VTTLADTDSGEVVRDARAVLAHVAPWRHTVSHMNWRQGEHVSVIGPTGIGKTEVIARLIEARRYCVFLGTKNKDSTQDRLRRMGFTYAKDSAAINAQVNPRVIVKPGHPPKASAEAIKLHHQQVFRETLNRVYRQGGWTLLLDELRYLFRNLGLTSELDLLYLQGRSEDISVVSAAQRPKWVPLEVFSMPVHLFFFRDMDHVNVSRIAEIVSVHRSLITHVVPRLRGHDVLYVNSRTGDLFITNTRK